jgi:tetratricopeptide (TPR) repeat protein
MRVISLLLLLTTAGTACSRHPFEHFLSSGERYLTARKFAEAALEFQNAARLDPESAVTQMRLGDAYSALHQTAAGAYQRACSLNPRDPKPCVQAAAALLALDSFDAAAAAARAALAADQFSLDAQLLLGSALAGIHRFAEAEERLEAALALAPADPRPYQALGLVQQQRGNIKAAEVWLRKAVNMNPESAGARLDLARLYLDAGRSADGENELRAAVTAKPDDVDANEMLASYLVSTDRCDAAEPYWKEAAAQSADGMGAIALADYYVSAGRTDAALKVLNDLKAPGQESAVSTRIAAILYDRGDSSKAETLVDRALERDRVSVDALLLRARMALDHHDVAKARDYAHRAAEISPDAPAVRNMLAAAAAASPNR